MTNKKQDPPYLPSHIANYFLWMAKEDNIKDITPMKLIKLVYFGYAWYYALFDKELFSEKIEAWRYGPVVPSIYHEFKRVASKPIDSFSIDFLPETKEMTFPIIRKDDINTAQILGMVWKIYKNKDGKELSDITHENGSPWDHAYDQGVNNHMNNSLIRKRAKEAILKYEDKL